MIIQTSKGDHDSVYAGGYPMGGHHTGSCGCGGYPYKHHHGCCGRDGDRYDEYNKVNLGGGGLGALWTIAGTGIAIAAERFLRDGARLPFLGGAGAAYPANGAYGVPYGMPHGGHHGCCDPCFVSKETYNQGLVIAAEGDKIAKLEAELDAVKRDAALTEKLQCNLDEQRAYFERRCDLTDKRLSTDEKEIAVENQRVKDYERLAECEFVRNKHLNLADRYIKVEEPRFENDARVCACNGRGINDGRVDNQSIVNDVIRALIATGLVTAPAPAAAAA